MGLLSVTISCSAVINPFSTAKLGFISYSLTTQIAAVLRT